MMEKIVPLLLGWVPKVGAWLFARWQSRLTETDRHVLCSAFFAGDAKNSLIQVGNHDFGLFVLAGGKDLSANVSPSVVADLVASVNRLARLGFLVAVLSDDPSTANYRLTPKGVKEVGRAPS
jgi:hypothetical protein